MTPPYPLVPSGDQHDLRYARGTVSVLLVDDDPLVRRSMSALLKHFGYTVTDAESGGEALKYAGKCRFDMLVTDYQMPEMDGFGLAQHLTKVWPSLPVLMLSGADPDLIPLEQLHSRRWEFLPKPVDVEKLIRIVDNQCLSLPSGPQ